MISSHPSVSPRIAVIGGGLAGACAAWALARGGAEVTVFERNHVASGASGAAVGALQPLTGMRLSIREENLRGFFRTKALVQELLVEGRTWRASGVLRLAVADEQAERWRARFDGLPAGLARWLEGPPLRAVEPRLHEHIVAGVCIDEACMVDIPAFVHALLAVSSAQVVEHTEVLAIERVASGLELRLSGGQRAVFDRVVIASGSQAPEPLRDEVMETAPYMGILAAFGGIEPPRVSLNCRGYIAAWHDDTVLVGTVDRRMPFDANEPTEASIAELRDRLHRVLDLQAEPHLVRVWKGIRPAMRDRAPVARMAHSMDDVWILTGFGGRGLLLGPSLAESFAEQLLGRRLTTARTV